MCFIKVHLAGTIFVICCHGVALWICFLRDHCMLMLMIPITYFEHIDLPEPRRDDIVFISNQHISYIFRAVNFFIKVTPCFTCWPNMLREQVVLIVR